MQCVNCDKEMLDKHHVETRLFSLRGENIAIEDKFYRCEHCKEEWSINGFDALAEAYRLYREKHRLLQPEELAAWRKEIGLTQKDVAKLLGCSEATINRYENGGLQDSAHNTLLVLVVKGKNTLRLVNLNGDSLPPEKKKRIMKHEQEERRRNFRTHVPYRASLTPCQV